MFRATSVFLTSLALAALVQTASCQTPQDEEPPVTLNSTTPVLLPTPSPVRRWDLEGRGDGSEHDFIYTSWANPGLVEITVNARAQRWLSNVTVTLEDGAGRELARVGTRAGADQSTTGNVFYRVLAREPIRVHVHVDENAGPYSISVNGPLDR
ncbi:MAG: hypothetical protein J0I12_09770 [Candidatus Eremiobacteraeota bacterium]|nr:hypothetical protein [Candidatus Eremiobacteraeota bacterium]